MSGTASVLKISLTSEPVAGVELQPYVLLQRPDGSHTTENIAEPVDAPSSATGVCLRQRWYRARSRVCTVHPEEPAIVQNLISRTFHCSIDCLTSFWAESVRDGTLAMHRQHAAGSNQLDHPGIPNGASGSHDTFHNTSQLQHERLRNAHASTAGPGTPPATANAGATSSSSINNYWREVARSRSYVPSQEDVGYPLCFEVTPLLLPTKTEAAPPTVLYTNRVITPAPPPVRSLVRLQPSPPPETQRVSVLTYNVLADLYAHSEAYAHLPAWKLSWAYRRKQLLREILSYNADIVTLQEVQSDHLEEDIRPRMREAGYEVEYKPKSTKMFTGSKATDDGCTADGCATFYKASKLELIKSYTLEYDKAIDSVVSSNRSEPSNEAQRLRKDNIALILVLSLRNAPSLDGSHKLLCVANTHVHANPEHTDVKVLQVCTLMKSVEKVHFSQTNIASIVCGDFNATPGSAAHQLVINGCVDAHLPELQQQDPLSVLRRPELQHDMDLSSCFTALANADPAKAPNPPNVQEQQARLDAEHGEPFFTNYTRTFKGTLDYIFHSRGSLQPVSVLELPNETDVQEVHTTEEPPEPTMPNSRYVSDHIALMAEFQINL